jgi:hypothetical protein
MRPIKSAHTPLHLGLACILASVLLHVIGLTSASRGMQVQLAPRADTEIILQTELLAEAATTPPARAIAPPSKMRVSTALARLPPAIDRQQVISPTTTSQAESSEPEAFPQAEPDPGSLSTVPTPLPPTSLATPDAPIAAQQAVTLARSAVLNYSIRYGNEDNPTPQGINTVRWQFVEDKFEIESISEATGLTSLLMRGTLIETSVGRVTAQGLSPIRYGDKRASKGERAVHFQREREVVSFSNRPQEVPLPVGVQDRLSLRYQLGLLLQATPSLQRPGSVIEVPVATPSGVDIWSIVVQKQEVLHTEAGDFSTIYMMRNKRADKPYEPTLELWVAPDLSWLPIRVRIVDANGRALDALLTKAQVQEN